VSRIFWDTNLFIYLIEDREPFSSQVDDLRQRMLYRGDELVTSVMTLAEIQVPARRAGDLVLARRFRETIKSVSRIVPFDEAATDRFAEIRTNPAVKSADAIQLSCAANAGATVFITNDRKLTRLVVPGIDFITTMDRLPF
jgi:predicted nucleic acid-binding protein